MALWDTLAAKVALNVASQGGSLEAALPRELLTAGGIHQKIAEAAYARTLAEHEQVVAAREAEKSSGALGWINTNVAPVVKAIGPVALGGLAAMAATPLLGAAGAKTAGSLLSSSLKSSQVTALPAALPIAPNPVPPSGGSMDFGGFTIPQVLTDVATAALNYRAQEQAAKALQTSMLPVAGAAGAAGGILARLGIGAAGAAVVTVGKRLIQTAAGAMTKSRVVAIAKSMGSIAAAAAALGLSEAVVAQFVIDEAKTKRRGRGVTAAQIKTTRRTMRTVVGLYKQIQGACSSAGVRGRSRTVFVGKGKSCR